MSIISQTIPNLINGVSQQPFALRLASQGEVQINGFSSVVDGLRKRAPTRHVAKILPQPLTNAYLHTINRDAQERYTVVLGNNDLRVFKLDGTEVTVNFPNGKAYLAAVSPGETFRAVTVADYTFIVNTNFTVAMTAETIPTRPFEAMYWVRQGAYKANYVARASGTDAVFTTPSSEVEDNAAFIATDYIANQLYQDFLALVPFGYTVEVFGSTIRVSHPTAQFAAWTTDSVGDTAMKLIYGSVQRFSDLPARGYPGFKVAVRGDNESAFSEYYVEFAEQPSNPFYGVWKEAAKDGIQCAIDPATMPHGLVREANGTFTFKRLDWAKRKVGDDNSNPLPSFVGKRINDIFFHRNRLGLLADENVILSKAGEFFTFWKDSALGTVDSDVIDVAASHVKVSILKHAVPFNETLVLFADQTQFQLGKAELLTPKTISIQQTTEFEASTRARPVGSGKNVFFAVEQGSYAGFREYFVNADLETNDAADVTAHVPRYIPKGIVKVVASSNFDVLAALSENDRNSLYVYKYYWVQDQKLQSSWSKWTFPAGTQVMNMDFIGTDLYLVVSRPSGTYIEVMSLDQGSKAGAAQIDCHLDRRFSEAQVTGLAYNAATNQTTFTMPFTPETGETYRLVVWYGDDTQTFKPGVVPTWTRSGNVVTVTGKVTKFLMGANYEFRYRMSPLVIREQASGGEHAVGEGRVQIRRVTVAYSTTGYLRAEVTPLGGSKYTYVFSGRTLGSVENKVGEIALDTGGFRFPVQAKNDHVSIDLINDSHLPSALLNVEWEGFYNTRSRRV